MSEEEKKAIEYWKRDISLYHYNTQLCSEHYAQIILNLIDNQQKGISLLKDQLEYVKSEYEETIEQQQKEIEELKNTETYKIAIIDKDKYISKDKIKAILEDYTEKAKHPLVNPQSREEYTFGIRTLQTLLEEE